MSKENVQLGQLLKGDEGRDAVHIAVAPMVAAHCLPPGHAVGINEKGEAYDGGEKVGIVDPFLTHWVDPGERFWLCLYPGTITGLRHVWSHPAFAVKVPKKLEVTADER